MERYYLAEEVLLQLLITCLLSLKSRVSAHGLICCCPWHVSHAVHCLCPLGSEMCGQWLLLKLVLPLGLCCLLSILKNKIKSGPGKPGLKMVEVALKLFMIKMEVVWEAQHRNSTVAHMQTSCRKIWFKIFGTS